MSMKDFLRYSKTAAALFVFLLFFALTTTVVFFEKQPTSWLDEIEVGEPAPRDIFAPVSFTLLNAKETAKLRQSLRDQAMSVYSMDSKAVEKRSRHAESFLNALDNYRNDSKRDSAEIAAKYGLTPDEGKTFLEIKDWKEMKLELQKILLDPLDKGILTDEAKAQLLDRGVKTIFIHGPGDRETSSFVNDIPSSREILSHSEKQIQKTIKGPRKLESLWISLSEKTLLSTLSFDEIKTEKKRKKLENETPPIMDVVKKNQILVGKGKIVTEKEHQQIIEASVQLAKRKALSTFIARAILIFITFGIFAFYVFTFENKIFFDLKNLLLVNSIIFLTVILERIAFLMPESLIYFILPVSLVTLLLTILVNFRMALVGAIVITIFTSVLSGFRSDIILFALFGSFAGIFATVGLKKRSQFLKAGAFIGLVNFAVLFSYWIFNNVSFRGSFQLGALGLANGFLMAVFVFFLVFAFEKVFKVTTDITLLELSDLNHPLLKRMVVEAPGTYHHTLMIANLCEAAAEAIGANPLLARVGAYFHDIGKMANPHYYVENEAVERAEAEEVHPSPHEELMPVKSKEIILEHVKKGIELGKKCKLPQIILDFIPEHHGTSVVYYFYHKAKKKRRPGEAAVKESDFRYQGPKPRSKETAIALLADSVEAVVRTLSDHSSENMTENVKKIINEKFIDGQLDECSLTLKDLETIAESFVRTLTGVYHKRIQYPEKDEKEAKPKPFSD